MSTLYGTAEVVRVEMDFDRDELRVQVFNLNGSIEFESITKDPAASFRFEVMKALDRATAFINRDRQVF